MRVRRARFRARDLPTASAPRFPMWLFTKDIYDRHEDTEIQVAKNGVVRESLSDRFGALAAQPVVDYVFGYEQREYIERA